MATGDNNEGQSPWWTRPPFLLAAGFLVIVVVLGAWLAVGGRSGHGLASAPGRGSSHPSATTSPATSSAVTSHAPTTSPPARTDRCHLPGADQQVPAVAPAGVTWQLWQSVALPFSKAAGPQIVQGNVARCYAHSPTGALLAAAQIQYRLGISSNWRQIADTQIMPGPGRNAFIRLATSGSKAPSPPTPPGTYAEIAAYLFVTYSSRVAVVEIITRSDSGAMGLETNTVDWSSGDWKLVLQPNGQVTPSVQPVTSTVGYVMWGGV
jgi:hypothetical protein